ncbi:MAG: chorismate-binding protein [Bacteroidota bacterium]|nr:chorismate-binding protein [Bacteroidota bacterium]
MSQEELASQLENHFKKQLPFVIYSKPGAATLQVIFQEDKKLHTTSTYDEEGFVFAPFDSNQPGILIKGKPAEIIVSSAAFEFNSVEKTIETKDADQHIALVEKAIETITDSDLKKVVLSRKQNISIKASSPIPLFFKLNQKYPTAFTYLWYHPKVGTWLGATPETLLALKGQRLETMALAGTQSYSGSTDVDWGLKEQEEQQMVTDEIASKLAGFDFKSFRVHDRETYRAGGLLHLRTKITGNLAPTENPLKALLSALHPTPAVCGLPRDLAKSFINEQESYDRAFYTGFLGEINQLQDHSKRRTRRNVENLAYKTVKKTSELYVNLRCMQFKPQMASLYVGGGITAGSDARQEWQETVNKAQTIASIL